MQSLIWAAHQGHKHVVLVTGYSGVAEEWIVANGSDGNFAFLALEE
jgi:hypothetical protein